MRHKAHLVGDGSAYLVDIDWGETFNPIVKTSTIWIVLSLALSKKLSIHQLASQTPRKLFWHDDMNETIYIHQPAGFHIDPTHLDYVYLLRIFRHGFKQASQMLTLSSTLLVSIIAKVFIYNNGENNAYFFSLVCG